MVVAVASAFLPGLASAQQEQTIRVGTLKLIHGITLYFYQQFAPEGVTVEVVPYESPTDGKNAVATGTVHFGIFGLAAATLGGSLGEPVVIVGGATNRGMAVVSGKDSDINTIAEA